MALKISLLGPPRIERDGRAVSFDTRKAIALLAHLALAERPRSRAALCELLWPDRDPDRARGALRRTLSTLRKAVGDEWLETQGDSVALRRGPGLELDVERFRALVAGEPSAEALAAGAELCRGELLEGFGLRDSPPFDDWQLAQADALRRELAGALGRLVGLLAQRGEHGRAIPHARRWLELEPLHEPAHRALIRLYAWSGDRGAALRQYRDCVRTLSQELGVAPLEETAALFEQVSEGTLAPATPPAPERRPPREAPPELPLVGRAAELEALRAAHAAAVHGHLAVIEGEAGIGKTRLAAEIMSAAVDEGAVVLAARCHEDEAGLPYAPVVELLRQALAGATACSPQRLADASLLLPDLAAVRPDLPAPLSPSAPGAQARLFEAVAGVLAAACAGRVPGVVFVDDVHAADEATQDVLTYLGRRLRGRSLLLVVSWRTDGVPPGHRLRRLTADLARDDAVTIVRLPRLGEDDVAELVRAAGAAPELASRVHLESEGLPLFVAEYLSAGGDALEVGGLLGARLGGLGAAARQVLGAAAVVGRSFDFDAVRAASGRSDEETVQALEELVAQGVVREIDARAPAYDFSHEQLRRLAYQETSLARRRLLHRRVAEALPSGGDTAALVAQHLSRAGEHARAGEQHRVAAEHAASLLAHGDALEHLEAALALGASDFAALHERIGELRTLTGDYAGAIASYEAAAAQAGAPAAIEHKLGGVHARRGEWERSEARLMAALATVPPDARGLQARILADLSLAAHHAGRPDEAAARAHEAHELAAAADDPHALSQAHNMLGMLARARGEPATARQELERSIPLADAAAGAAALNNLALVERDAGDLERALELTQRALDLCAASGDRHREAALENNLADLHHAAGHDDAAMIHLKRAVAIFTEVGGDEATRLPEIWKLVSW